jgi:hypothetical protein
MIATIAGNMVSKFKFGLTPESGLWVGPEMAASRIAPSTKPTMPTALKRKLRQPVNRWRWDS